MKKIFAMILAAVLLASCFGVLAAAKQYSVVVGDIEIPFEISDNWYVSTLGNIDPGFQEGNDLTKSYFNRFMYSFGYALWLKNKKIDNEIILVVKAADAGQKDYSALSDGELNAIAQAQQSLVPDELTARTEFTKFVSGTVVFLRSESEIAGISAVYYSTVVDGVSYEVRLNAVNDPIANASVSQQDSLVNDLAAALTFPGSYPSAPETTLPEDIEADETEIFDFAETTALPQPSQTRGNDVSSAATTGASDGNETTAATQENPDVSASETGIDNTTAPQDFSDGSGATQEAFSMEEYVPGAKQPASQNKTIYIAAAVAAAAVVAAVVAVIVIKKKK
ncbi:MAG: hypothetical protein IJK23_07460 [Clostridia bacterium]|nr:hypothetical protein [Clostridia bacterium]